MKYEKTLRHQLDNILTSIYMMNDNSGQFTIQINTTELI